MIFLNGFASVALVMMFFEWVCSGDDFFLNGFAPVFDRWPGFQISGVDRWPGLGFWSVARFLNGFVFVCVAWLCCWVVFVCGFVVGLMFVFVCVGVW